MSSAWSSFFLVVDYPEPTGDGPARAATVLWSVCYQQNRIVGSGLAS
jgi:hypothetical protein